MSKTQTRLHLWGGDIDDRKFTCGYIFQFGSCSIT